MAISTSIFIVMGVSGCGKTTMARMLARATGGTCLDADDFHSAESKAKMAAGIPLTDEDRWPWLDRINRKLVAMNEAQSPVFLACSALKQKYRDRLSAGLPLVRFIYLKGSLELIRSRLANRQNHFMPQELLESQFADLEEPHDALVLDISRTAEQLRNDLAKTGSIPGWKDGESSSYRPGQPWSRRQSRRRTVSCPGSADPRPRRRERS